MLAASFLGKGRIELREVPIPKPGEGQVLVKVAACALCGSDRDLYHYGSKTVPGHETAGTIVETGSGTSLKLGTHGSVYLFSWCGSCSSCKKGRYGRCYDTKADYGYREPGGFEEYMVVDEQSFLPVPENISVEEAVMLLDVCGTTGHALRRGKIKSAKTVAVLGSGPIGLGTVFMAQQLGKLDKIVATDIVPYRLRLAESLGAKVYDALETNWLTKIEEDEPAGFDIVLETTAKPDIQSKSINLCNDGGWVVLIGIPSSKIIGKMEIVDTKDFILSEKNVTGSEYFLPEEFEENLSLLKKAKLNIEKIITHKYPLKKIEVAYQKFWSGNTGKVLVGSCLW
jgi:propanol-preferring alcohol dehydrogenase